MGHTRARLLPVLSLPDTPLAGAQFLNIKQFSLTPDIVSIDISEMTVLSTIKFSSLYYFPSKTQSFLFCDCFTFAICTCISIYIIETGHYIAIFVQGVMLLLVFWSETQQSIKQHC